MDCCTSADHALCSMHCSLCELVSVVYVLCGCSDYPRVFVLYVFCYWCLATVGVGSDWIASAIKLVPITKPHKMKPKPISHKNENTFKFESFNERLCKINISTVNHLKRRFDADEKDDNLSFFAIALEKWQDLNCTQDYKDVRQKIGSSLDVQNLVQIIHHKNELSKILIDALKVKETKALNAILELIIALARDLQSEFYEYFPVIFDSLVDLSCELDQADMIEALFVCETFLFKYLWKFILKDIDQHFDATIKALRSKKEYVLNFSSEVFSFLIKKSNHQDELIRMLFDKLKNNSAIDKGVGRILFECIKGVNHAFHSSSKSILNIIFNQYLEWQSNELDEMMHYFIEYLLEYTTKDSFKFIWNYLLLDSAKFSPKIVPLIKQAIVFKKCNRVHDSSIVLTTIMEYLSKNSLEESDKLLLLQSLEHIFNILSTELSIENVVQFCDRLFVSGEYAILSMEQIFTFSQNIINNCLFDVIFNKYCCKLCLDLLTSENDETVYKCLRFLAYLVVNKRPRFAYGKEINNISKYLLQFNDEGKLEAILHELLEKSSDLSILLFCIIIMPNLSFISTTSKACNSIHRILDKIESFTVTQTANDNGFKLIGHLMFESIVSLILLKNHQSVIEEISAHRIIDLIKLHSDVTEFLQSLNIYLTYNKSVSNQTINDLYPSLYPLLQKNFSSSNRLERIVSLHVATLFDYSLPPEATLLDETSRQTIFEICLDAELVPPELAQYRDRLKHVRKLDCNFVKSHIPVIESHSSISLDLAPVYYILGSLYENLTLLWKPTIEVLETYATTANNKKDLTEVLLSDFKKTNSLLSANRLNRANLYEELFNINPLSHLNSVHSTPDHDNHRCLLLKAFESFPQIIEPRNKDFLEFFFSFLETEMKSKFIHIANGKENLKIQDENELDHDLNNEIVESSDLKILWKTFFAFLTLLAKFKNPKALYREVELRQMYLNMLISPNSALQRHAISCLFTYNQPYLIKYKDNFLKLVDDKTFSSEIHTFIMHDNPDDNLIKDDDRADVTPIFFRILYGKMLASSGTKIHGKSKIDFLRSIILKVISSFTESSQIQFMDLIFSSLKPFLSTKYEQINDELQSVVNIEAFFVPWKQFQSLITTLEFLMKHFGSRSLPVVRYMFKVLIVCCSICNHVLSSNNRSQVKEYIVNSFKTFRSNCFKVSEYFFVHFEKYSFIAEEIDAFMVALIKPMISNLQTDSLSSPSPLLRLFNKWSENPRYYVLLGKHIEPQSCYTAMEAIIQLYVHPKISNTTISFITGIIENLLTYDNDKSDMEEEPIEINNYGKPLAKLSDYPQLSNENVNFGSLLLIPFIKDILERIHLNYSANISNNSKFEFTLQEINVLARLSFFVKDPSDSATFSSLLIYSISQSRRPDEDKEIFTLKTLNHLAKNILEKDYLKLLHQTFALFHLIEKPLSRRELCNFVCTLSENRGDFALMSQLVRDINSYDSRLPEEPDYDKRISGFKSVLSMLDNFDQLNSVRLDFIHLLLENTSFFINHYDDLSLKDLSSSVIIKICQLLKECDQEVFNRYVMNLIFYRILSIGFRQPKESTRSEYIDIMMNVLKIFSHRHEIILQLRSLFFEQENEEEVNFWLNIKHIQLHRRARALNRLAQDDALLASMSSRVFTSFLIPLVTNFITEQHYSKNVSLFTAAVDSLATFLQYCSWFKYDSTLSNYIHRLLNNKMEPKIAIRVISALLAKFSFLQPHDVAAIEKQLKVDDFKSISLEYSFLSSKSKSNGPKHKHSKKKFAKKGQVKNDLNTDTVSKQENNTAVQNDVDAIEEEEMRHIETIHSKEANNSSYSLKIYNSLCKKLLPLLHKCLHQRSQIDYMHDNYKDQFPEDEEIQRIPISLAIVKLLKHVQLNKQLFEANITSINLRLCQFLQSRTDSIRETARNSLVQIMQTLGPQHFNAIFYEMKALLSRGYQRHILIYTVYIIMTNLISQFRGGDLDKCMNDIIELCHQELFGSLAEEKEVSQIVTKTKEAKKLKSYDIYEILAQFVSKSALSTLLSPLKEVLLETSSHKTMKKVESAFYKIGRGLVANRFLSPECLLEMISNILSTTLPEVDNVKDSSKMVCLSQKLPSKLDSFLIPAKSLRRVHQVSKINRASNSHILSDFALTCYLYLIKNNRLEVDNASQLEMIESTVAQLNGFLHSKDMKVITSTMQCIHTLLIKFPELSSFKQVTQQVISQIFVLLNKYSGLGDDNSQLIALCFKAIAHFVHIRSECKLNNDEITVLLSYAEKDIESNSQSSTIYFLLKSIISRKFVSKELHLLMEKLLVLAITTEIDHVRSHAMELSVKYLTEYPIEPTRFKGKMVKLARQLEYQTVAGRIAAISILKNVISLLTYDTLEPLKINLFVPIASQLVNEESAECKKLIAQTLATIISKLSKGDRDTLFDTFVEPWLGCDSILVQTLASHLCLIYVKYEKNNFEVRLASCLPLVRQQLDPTRFSFLGEQQSDQTDVSTEHKNEDNLILQHLTFVSNLLKLDSITQLLTKAKYFDDFNCIFDFINTAYLLHPHSWVRHLAVQIFGQLFSLWKEPKSFVLDLDLYKNSYLFQNTEEVLFQLGKKFCLVFRDVYNCQSACEQLIKNLVYIAGLMIYLEYDAKEGSRLTEHSKISLRWLINKLVFEVKYEIKNCPEKTLKRLLVFKWIAAVAVLLYSEEKRKDRVIKYLPNLLPPLCREKVTTLSDEIANPDNQQAKEELVSLNKQVFQLFKMQLGGDFTEHYNKIRDEISHKRLERRKNRAIQMVTNVDLGVKRKQRKHKKDRLMQSNKRHKVTK